VPMTGAGSGQGQTSPAAFHTCLALPRSFTAPSPHPAPAQPHPAPCLRFTTLRSQASVSCASAVGAMHLAGGRASACRTHAKPPPAPFPHLPPPTPPHPTPPVAANGIVSAEFNSTYLTIKTLDDGDVTASLAGACHGLGKRHPGRARQCGPGSWSPTSSPSAPAGPATPAPQRLSPHLPPPPTPSLTPTLYHDSSAVW
jgi:hypothetical protein